MKIGIDARLFGAKHGGIGRYAQELIKTLEKLDQQNEYYVFLAEDGFDKYQPSSKNFHKVRADFRAYSLSEQVFLPLLLNKYKLDLVHFTHFNVPIFYRGKFIVTIHDLIISHYPDSRATTLNPALYKSKLFFYDRVIKNTAKRAQKIIAVSQFTADDIAEQLNVKSEKIQVVYEGVDLPATGAVDQEVLKRLNLSGDFMMYVGSAYPHKNLEKLIEAFNLIEADLPDLKLVLVGKLNFFYQRLKDFVAEKYSNIASKIIFTDYLKDEELATLYQSAKLYVFPSLIEGFGLPPLEAQNYGLPVVSSNSSCLPEILGDSAVYFDPDNQREMAEAIKKVLGDGALQQKLVSTGFENLKKYSWQKMGEEILGIYKRFE